MAAEAILALMDQSAWAVVDKLAKWDEKFDHVRANDRSHARTPCRLVMTAWFADEKWRLVSGETRIWVRNISRGGLCFVLNEDFAETHVRIRTSSTNSGTTMQGHVMSRRETHDGFFEYGVKFAGRVDDADASEA